jgi:phosphoglycolate phosphatase
MDHTLQESNLTSNGFRWRNADAYLFDIDGTLLVMRDLVHWNALHQAMLEAYDVDTSIEGIAYHGKTDLGILRAALKRAGVSGAAFEQKLPSALDVVCREVRINAAGIRAEVCPQIPELLSTLRASGKLIGVASGNLESVGWQKIEAAGLREYFSFGRFSDRCEMRSEIFRDAIAEVGQRLGNDARVCFVGDTPEDIRAAKLVGAHIVAVGTGIFKLEELMCHEPDICVASCAELGE